MIGINEVTNLIQHQKDVSKPAPVVTFAKPSPVSRMIPSKSIHKSTSAGKRINKYRSEYDTTEKPSDRSSADEEHAVDSPVGGGRLQSPTAARKRSRANSHPSSDSSSSSSEESRAASPVPEKRRKSSHEKLEDSRRHRSSTPAPRPRSSAVERTENNTAKSDRPRSQSRSRSEDTASAQEGAAQRPSPSPTRRQFQTSSQLNRTPTPRRESISVEEPSEEVLESSNRVYKKIRDSKTSSRPKEVDSVSCAQTSVSSKMSVNVRSRNSKSNSLTFTDLQQVLNENLRNNALAQDSVRTLYDNATESELKRKQIVDQVRSIYNVLPNEPAEPRLKIENYLICSYTNTTFGYDQDDLRKNGNLEKNSLMSALTVLCDRNENSLDTVFRRSLREIADELFPFDETDKLSLDNPKYISGMYLELRLLQKIRKHYRTVLGGGDIAVYLTKLVIDEASPFHKLVSGNAAETYIKTLYERYKINSENFEDTMKKMLYAPMKMRVWTDAATQTATSTAIVNFMKRVFSLKEYSATNEGIEEMIFDYSEEMKRFFAVNHGFLSEVCKASELFAWMCFGIVTNDSEDGSCNMALNSYFVKKEVDTGKKDNSICWNYPLTTMIDREITPVPEKKSNSRRLMEHVRQTNNANEQK